MSGSDGPDASVRIEGFSAFRRVGSGGFSSVYSARQERLGRDVAVKVLHADFSSEIDRRTFERECQALGLLSRHPNIVTVYSEAFTVEGRPCIVMELYHGNYRERLDAVGPMPIPELLGLGIKVAGALQAAHDRGILHRDLKPHNLFQSDYGEPALGDFGISTIDDERSISGATGLSVAYAAPEVLEEAAATSSADVYSLAATLFHLAEGAAPFSSPQLRTTVKRILTEEPHDLTRSDASASLSAALRRGLAKDPSDRFSSAEAFGETLRGIQAELGLDRTEIPLRRGRSGEQTGEAAARAEQTPRVQQGNGESTVARQRAVPEQPPATTPAPGPRPNRQPERTPSSSQDAAESTVVRARAELDEALVDVDEAEPSKQRQWTAIALGAATVIGVVVAALVIGGGGSDDESIATTTQLIVPDTNDPIVFSFVDSPESVEVTAGDVGQAVVSFGPVDGAGRYEARSVFPSVRVDRFVSGDSSPLESEVAVKDATCWVVRAISTTGQASDPSEPVCLAE